MLRQFLIVKNAVNRVSKVTYSLPYSDSSFEICHSSCKKGTGAEMRPAIISAIAPVSYWPIFFTVPSNSPRNLSESKLAPVFFSLFKWLIKPIRFNP